MSIPCRALYMSTHVIPHTYVALVLVYHVLYHVGMEVAHMATMTEVQRVRVAVRSAVAGGAGASWDHEAARAARKETERLGMTWDFVSWPHVLEVLESAERGDRIFGVRVE